MLWMLRTRRSGCLGSVSATAGLRRVHCTSGLLGCTMESFLSLCHAQHTHCWRYLRLAVPGEGCSSKSRSHNSPAVPPLPAAPSLRFSCA